MSSSISNVFIGAGLGAGSLAFLVLGLTIGTSSSGGKAEPWAKAVCQAQFNANTEFKPEQKSAAIITPDISDGTCTAKTGAHTYKWNAFNKTP